MEDTEKRFTLRVDLDLFNRISRIAKKERRSVAAQIELAIEEYVHKYEDFERYQESNTFWDKISFITDDLLIPSLLDISFILSNRLFSMYIVIRSIPFSFLRLNV